MKLGFTFPEFTSLEKVRQLGPMLPAALLGSGLSAFRQIASDYSILPRPVAIIGGDSSVESSDHWQPNP